MWSKYTSDVLEKSERETIKDRAVANASVTPIECVMFDFAGPLAHFDGVAHWDFFSRYTTSRSAQARAFFDDIYNPDLIAFEVGEIDTFEFYRRLKNLLGLKISMMEFVGFLRNQFVLDPDMVRLVRDLRAQGVEAVLISNINQLHEDSVRDRYPGFLNLFSYTMLSHQRGYRKPDERMWRVPMRELGLNADRCVYVDDIQHHVQVFESMGGRGYHYDIFGDRYILDRARLAQYRIAFIRMLEQLGVFED